MSRVLTNRMISFRLLSIASLVCLSLTAGSSRTAGPMDASATDKLEAASRRYVGTPYRLFPLGEGSAERGSPKPLFNERGVDCVTFVEQSLAHALAPKPSEVVPFLQRIRYRSGRIHFGARNHFFLADWMENNGWLVEDDTRRIAGSRVKRVTKILDRSLPASEHGMQTWRGSLPAGGERLPLEVTYIPSGALPKSMVRFPGAAIVAFVPKRKDMDASHVGFVFRRNGWTLRHASSTRKRVVDEPFLRYVQRRGRGLLGVVVLRPRDFD